MAFLAPPSGGIYLVKNPDPRSVAKMGTVHEDPPHLLRAGPCTDHLRWLPRGKKELRRQWRWRRWRRWRGRRGRRWGVHFAPPYLRGYRPRFFSSHLNGRTYCSCDRHESGRRKTAIIFLGGRSEAQLQRYLLAHKWPTFSLPFAGTANWMR